MEEMPFGCIVYISDLFIEGITFLLQLAKIKTVKLLDLKFLKFKTHMLKHHLKIAFLNVRQFNYVINEKSIGKR